MILTSTMSCLMQRPWRSNYHYLQAAGGTLPLYIEVGGDSREVHGLFGVSNTTMVNTGAGATKAPVMYRVDGTGAVNVKVEGQNAEVYNTESGDRQSSAEDTCRDKI